jgi:hypothetical protein
MSEDGAEDDIFDEERAAYPSSANDNETDTTEPPPRSSPSHSNNGNNRNNKSGKADSSNETTGKEITDDANAPELDGISNADLHYEVRSILASADLSTTTVRILIDTLSRTHPTIDFTSKKPFIRGILEKFASEKVEEIQQVKQRMTWRKELAEVRSDYKTARQKMKYNQDSDSNSELDDDEYERERDERSKKWKEDIEANDGARNSKHFVSSIFHLLKCLMPCILLILQRKQAKPAAGSRMSFYILV